MLTVLFEDEHIMVINKPGGVAVEATANNTTVLKDFITTNIMPVHRLDQRVSGILLLAKTKESFTVLSEDFRQRKIEKIYKAVVAQQPLQREATLQHWLLKDNKQSKSKVFTKPLQHATEAVLHYTVIQSSIKYHLLQITLLTGRFHQIRAQLAAIGSPIVGDVKYGYKRTTTDGSIFLQSNKITFQHPVTKELMQFELALPELWKKYGFE
ncbi:MAG: RNA pseudouridine synthase [Chitinophaga sp.]|jgi:23S rRNA pseudouridine1911/1915/1917 synthase|nr:RNA pseudouridine synthase [Chitinophaga sp.]